MSYYLSLVFLFSCTIIGSLILTKLSIKYLPLIGVVDKPSNRKVHLQPTPGGAGIGLIILFLIGMPLFEYHVYGNLNYAKIMVPILSTISLISFIDDIRDLSVPLRLFFHILSALLINFIIIYPDYRLFHGLVPAEFDLILTSLGLVAFLNIYNFLDGIDGITAAESIHLAATILVLCYLKYDIIIHANLLIMMSVIILGFCIGFIPFNWHPAKVFIGDVGSISLGFIFGICLICLSSSSWHLFVSSTIAALYYLFDGVFTIIIRLINNEQIWQPHVKHFFQQAVKKGMSHKQVTIKISLCNLALFILSISALYYPITSLILSILAVCYLLMHFSK
jgi:UDP-N-acetylmuramyl pentapeptide phosphotransferase/UDP-N-acetylglucosamine-1-phosphate transferase